MKRNKEFGLFTKPSKLIAKLVGGLVNIGIRIQKT